MPWFWWWRRNKAAGPSASVAAKSRPLFVPGRETVAAGASHYVVPHDHHETNRLDLQHSAMHEYFGTHVFAPVADPQRILDVAGGTGVWAKALKEQFPQAQVTSMDVTVPLDVQEKGPPSAYTFVQANALEPLPFPDAAFDYVHMRFMFTAMPVTMWPQVVRELVRVTTPGGWIELVEAYVPRDAGPAWTQLEMWANQLFALRDIDASLASQVGKFLRDAGATQVHERSDALPLGAYGGRVGQLMALDMASVYRLAMPAFVQGLGLDQRRIEATLSQADAEVQRGEYQGILPIYIAFGQRPNRA